jgi:Na+/proline symporter
MGVMVVGMFSATLATMGSELNVLAGILTNDVYKSVVKPKATEKELLVVGRITTALMGILIVLVAILISLLQSYNLFDLMMKAFGAILPATTLPILAGLFWKRINVKGALLGLIAGAISGILLVIINVFLVHQYQAEMNTNPSLQYWLKQGWDGVSILVNVVVTIGVMYLGSKLFRTSHEEKSKIDLFFKDLAVPITVQSNTKSASISNFKVIGISTALFGMLLALAGIGIKLFNENTEKYGVTISIGVLLVVLGVLMYMLSYKKSRSNDQ